LVSFANIAPQYFFTQLGRLSPLCNLLLCNTILRTFLEESEVEHCKTFQFSCMQAHNSMLGCNSLPKGAVLCQAKLSCDVMSKDILTSYREYISSCDTTAKMKWVYIIVSEQQKIICKPHFILIVCSSFTSKTKGMSPV